MELRWYQHITQDLLGETIYVVKELNSREIKVLTIEVTKISFEENHLPSAIINDIYTFPIQNEKLHIFSNRNTLYEYLVEII